MPQEVRYTAQYCLGDRDITADFYAAEDADRVRFWQDDFCLLELARHPDGWEPSGGDGPWTAIAWRRFREPIDALRLYLPPEGNYELIAEE